LLGQRHRLTGPAIEEANGRQEWWINNQKLEVNSQEEFERLMKLKVFW